MITSVVFVFWLPLSSSYDYNGEVVGHILRLKMQNKSDII